MWNLSVRTVSFLNCPEPWLTSNLFTDVLANRYLMKWFWTTYFYLLLTVKLKCQQSVTINGGKTPNKSKLTLTVRSEYFHHSGSNRLSNTNVPIYAVPPCQMISGLLLSASSFWTNSTIHISPTCPLTWEWLSLPQLYTRQSNAECDPLHEYVDRCPCSLVLSLSLSRQISGISQWNSSMDWGQHKRAAISLYFLLSFFLSFFFFFSSIISPSARCFPGRKAGFPFFNLSLPRLSF